MFFYLIMESRRWDQVWFIINPRVGVDLNVVAESNEVEMIDFFGRGGLFMRMCEVMVRRLQRARAGLIVSQQVVSPECSPPEQNSGAEI